VCKAETFSIGRRVVLLLFTLLVFLGVTSHGALAAVTFVWQASPQQDDIVGYRLYYGSQSRSVIGDYEQFIDFSTLQRCPVQGSDYACQPLTTGDITCENLYRDTPKCTVNDLNDHLFFAMTAYNSTLESEYSDEVEYRPPGWISPRVGRTLHLIYSILLDEDRRN